MRFRSHVGIQLLLAASLLLGAAPAAGAAPAKTMRIENTWASRAKNKLLSGGKNLLLGWTELVTEPDESLWGGTSVTAGILRGVWNAVGQTLGGAARVLTFPYPDLAIPLPEGGVRWQRPETASLRR